VYAQRSSNNHLFSPSALPASLQTSTFQAHNQLTGIAVSITRKTDVKNHLSARWLTQNRPQSVAERPNVAEFSGTDQDDLELPSLSFADDFFAEHSPASIVPAPALISTVGIRPPNESASRQD